jgi:hypothetical protein
MPQNRAAVTTLWNHGWLGMREPEAVDVLKAHGIRPATVTRLPLVLKLVQRRYDRLADAIRRAS